MVVIGDAGDGAGAGVEGSLIASGGPRGGLSGVGGKSQNSFDFYQTKPKRAEKDIEFGSRFFSFRIQFKYLKSIKAH